MSACKSSNGAQNDLNNNTNIVNSNTSSAFVKRDSLDKSKNSKDVLGECDAEKQTGEMPSQLENKDSYGDKRDNLDKISFVLASDAAQVINETADEASPMLDIFETNKKNSLKEIKNHICDEVIHYIYLLSF